VATALISKPSSQQSLLPYTPTSNALFQAGYPPAGRFHAGAESALYGMIAEGLAVGLMREDLALKGQKSGVLSLWPGRVPSLHLRFVLPSICRDEPVGCALTEAAMRTWDASRTRQDARVDDE